MSSTEVAPERTSVPGVIALVTLGAFENRAVGTALPTMVRDAATRVPTRHQIAFVHGPVNRTRR
jgi:hypothetical protein